jgi:hypothetical protein
MSSIKVATAMIFGKYEAKPLVLSLSSAKEYAENSDR